MASGGKVMSDAELVAAAHHHALERLRPGGAGAPWGELPFAERRLRVRTIEELVAGGVIGYPSELERAVLEARA